MQYRILGRTNLKVSLASFGTGGPSRIGQRTHGDEAIMHRVIQRALDLGINLIDTAANYSDSEAILGRALKETPRDRYVIATKFAPDPNENGQIISPEEMIASCERSLKLLNVDCIDIYQFHGNTPANYRDSVQRLYPTAEKLRQQGKIRFLGVTEYFFHDPEHKMLETALADDIWDTIMVKYGILNMTAERKVLPLAIEKNVGVMNMSAVRVKMTRPDVLETFVARLKQSGQIPADSVPDKNPLDFLVRGHVDSVVAAGYKFGAAHPGISTLLFGTGNIEHLEKNIDNINSSPLPDEDMTRLREIFSEVTEPEGDTG